LRRIGAAGVGSDWGGLSTSSRTTRGRT
jgi:hypothetical protein